MWCRQVGCLKTVDEIIGMEMIPFLKWVGVAWQQGWGKCVAGEQLS